MKHKLLNKSQIKEKYSAFVDLLFPGIRGEENILFFDELLYKYSVPIPNCGDSLDNYLEIISNCLSNPTVLSITLNKLSYSAIFEIYYRTVLFAQYLSYQEDNFTMEYIDEQILFMEMFSYRWNLSGTTIDSSLH